ncbi:MAG: PEP/pyruvate-binding domain-containing protein [Bacteroidota bacterium]
MIYQKFHIFCVISFFYFLLLDSEVTHAQEAQILNYSTDINGQVQLEVASTTESYYILNVRNQNTGDFQWTTSMTMGKEGTTIISEPLAAYPLEHYQVLEYPVNSPNDSDGDQVDDVTEFLDMPTQSPINHADPIDLVNGTVSINSLTTFKELSIVGEDVPFASYLNGLEFVKFIIIDVNTDNPKLYFVNSLTHKSHKDFTEALGIDITAIDELRGEVIYKPQTVSSNGTLGSFSFSFSVGLGKSFPDVQKTHEIIAANMPILRNNFSYLVTANSMEDYEEDKELYDDSRVPVLLQEDLFADVDYLALNVAEGYGFLRLMDLEETPRSRDVVIYESLPNSMPRVGGIITSVVQTPLSHVNIRAIQDDLPNAFIRDPLLIDSISDLIEKYVYYRVDQDKYFIREATLEEVNEWYENIRPDEAQNPPLNLEYQDILPLDEVTFDMFDGFGAKATNVATMLTFGFPEGTIPNGYAVPFYFYQEFMEFNGFFDIVQEMLDDPEFQSNLQVRIDRLDELRSDIKDAEMPQWMLDELQTMHESFPEGTSVRCRSSTNNEDLPGFSGAGLYTSKTQHPDEGHISKSIKQVFASIWNFRAFDERDFYRIDHFKASMGVLCHPNYQGELSNGVAVSTDPIYQTENTFYLNTQVGEDLVTNPGELSIPEEILLDRFPVTEDDYIVIRYSNLTEGDQLVMEEHHLDEMRDYLSVIHDEFQELYNADNNPDFAMDIEYKVTANNQLIIKQARPWASYWSNLETSLDPVEDASFRVNYFPNPVHENLHITCNCQMSKLTIVNQQGLTLIKQPLIPKGAHAQISFRQLPDGIYMLNAYDENENLMFTKKVIKIK